MRSKGKTEHSGTLILSRVPRLQPEQQATPARGQITWKAIAAPQSRPRGGPRSELQANADAATEEANPNDVGEIFATDPKLLFVFATHRQSESQSEQSCAHSTKPYGIEDFSKDPGVDSVGREAARNADEAAVGANADRDGTKEKCKSDGGQNFDAGCRA